MIINTSRYHCPNCDKYFDYDTSKEFSTKCPICKTEMEFIVNGNVDTDKLNRPKVAYFDGHGRRIPACPYCSSYNCKYVSTASRMTSVGFFGLASKKVGKQWHCKDCDSYF